MYDIIVGLTKHMILPSMTPPHDPGRVTRRLPDQATFEQFIDLLRLQQCCLILRTARHVTKRFMCKRKTRLTDQNSTS